MFSTLHKLYTNPTWQPYTTPTKNLHRNPAKDSAQNPTFCFLNMNNANGASVLLVAVCHNSQSASLLSDSGLVMYCSTRPAPSSSAPCILAILTHLWGWSQNVHFDTPPPKFFHTQGVISDLTLLAFGDEMYYICTEIWEEPRLPLFSSLSL